MILETLLTGRTIAFNVKLVWITGSVNAALLLSQLCYWSDKSDTLNLFYKTINEIEDEIGLSRHEQEAALKSLVAKKFVAYELRGVPAKRYFSIQWEAIEKALRSAVNIVPVQIAEKRQTSLRKNRAKKVEKPCRKSANKIAEKRQTGLPENGKFHIDDFIDDFNIEKEREENKFSDDEIDAFILSVCSSEKIRNPLSYETKLREQIQKGHKSTLYALADFLRKRELEAKKSEYERLTNRYFACSFEYQGVSYVFVRVGLCRDDVYYAGRFDNSDHVFLELYKNGNSEDRARIIFENLEVCKNYLKGVCDGK